MGVVGIGGKGKAWQEEHGIGMIVGLKDTWVELAWTGLGWT